jgi:hypothetical protein
LGDPTSLPAWYPGSNASRPRPDVYYVVAWVDSLAAESWTRLRIAGIDLAVHPNTLAGLSGRNLELEVKGDASRLIGRAY